MWSKIDGTTQFEQTSLSINAWSRECDERSIAGLDGVLSIDMGKRSRQIIQKGLLRAISEGSLSDMIEEFNEKVDGAEHTIELKDGRNFRNLRVDNITFGQTQNSGVGVTCSIKLTYTQLRQ